MRFRLLTLEELQPLEAEFKHFLSANGLPAEEWALIKQTQSARQDELIAQFSDMVLARALQNIKTLEYKTANCWYLFRYDATDAICVVLESDAPEQTNLLQLSFDELFTNENHIKNISVLSLRKAYQQNREDEIFKLMSSGSTIAPDTLFDTVYKLSKESV